MSSYQVVSCAAVGEDDRAVEQVAAVDGTPRGGANAGSERDEEVVQSASEEEEGDGSEEDDSEGDDEDDSEGDDEDDEDDDDDDDEDWQVEKEDACLERLRAGGQTLELHEAAIRGELDRVRALLEKEGSAVDERDDCGRTALAYAAECHHAEVAAALLELGAAVDAQDRDGKTILAYAQESGARSVIWELIPFYALIEKDGKGRTALSIAAENGFEDHVAELISKGTKDVNTADNYENTPLIFAAKSGEVDVVLELIKNGADVNARGNYGRTPLMQAAEWRCTDVIATLLANGADVNAKDNQGATALFLAWQKVDALAELVKGGALVDVQDNDGGTALSEAAERGVVDAVVFLLQSGATVDLKRNDGRTAMTEAAEGGHVDAVAALLQSGAAVDSKSNVDRTALSYAAEGGHVDAVEELIQHGATVDNNDNEGKSALWYAAQNDHRDVVAQLLRCGALGDEDTLSSEREALLVAASMGDVDAILKLVKDGASVDDTMTDGKTALFYAAECGQTDAVNALIESGASVRTTLRSSCSCWDGYTPLLVAGRAGNLNTVQALIEAGAPVNVRGTIDGETPLISAARWGYFAGVRLLITHGGTLRSEDAFGDEECPPLVPGTLETMRCLCAESHEYEPLCVHVLERLQETCSQLQQFERARLEEEGSLVTFASIIFRYCRLLFEIKERQRPLSRFIGRRAITGRLQDFHEEVDHFIGMLGMMQNGASSWKARWDEDLTRLQTRFQELLSADDRLVNGYDTDAAKLEAALLLQYELRLDGAKNGQPAQGDIQQVLDRFLRACAMDAPVVPEWFVSRDDVEFNSSTIVRSEWENKCYEGKWRSTSVMIETGPLKLEKFVHAASQWYPLSHPNVVKLFGACHIGESLLFIYELVTEGRPLYELVSDSTSRVSMWKHLYEAALGLQYLHNRGIFHGHLRSKNIIVGSDSVAKLSAVYEDPYRSMFDERIVAIWESSHMTYRMTPRSVTQDIFAFGLCIWHALALKLQLYEDMKRDDILKIVKENYPPDRPDGVDEVHWELIMQMCTPDVSERVNIAFVVNRLKQFAVNAELATGETILEQPTSTSASEIQSQSLDEHMFAELEGATIPKTLQTVLAKCEKLPEGQWMASNVYPALEYAFSLLQERQNIASDVEVARFCATLSRFQRYLRTAVSEKSVFELARSRQVAESHHVLYSELDRLLDMLGVSVTDPVRVWRKPDGEDATAGSNQTHGLNISSSTFQLQRGDESSSTASAVTLNYFDGPSTNHALWTQAGLAALATSPSWYLSLRELSFSEFDKIGQGAFGAVFRGSWLDTPVVVKFMGYEDDPDTISTDLLLHEVRVWHRLNHPHVLKLYGASHVDKRYFVCEYASNGELTQYLKRKEDEDEGSSKRLVWQKMHEAALGLQYLHGQSIAHNDLKCDNIMVGMDGKAKLIDFGLSAVVNEAEIQIGVKQIGAVNWRSPEYLAGGRPSFASDVYSFAMCIIEAVSGEVPWGKSIHPSIVRFKVKKGNLPSLPESMNEKQRHLIRLMTKADPSERVKMAFVVDKLNEIAQDEKATNAP